MSDQLVTMIANLESKTGRSLGDWADLVRAGQLTKHGEIVRCLKSENLSAADAPT